MHEAAGESTQPPLKSPTLFSLSNRSSGPVAWFYGSVGSYCKSHTPSWLAIIPQPAFSSPPLHPQPTFSIVILATFLIPLATSRAAAQGPRLNTCRWFPAKRCPGKRCRKISRLKGKWVLKKKKNKMLRFSPAWDPRPGHLDSGAEGGGGDEFIRPLPAVSRGHSQKVFGKQVFK